MRDQAARKIDETDLDDLIRRGTVKWAWVRRFEEKMADAADLLDPDCHRRLDFAIAAVAFAWRAVSLLSNAEMEDLARRLGRVAGERIQAGEEGMG